jgi:hypothetical protein
LAEAEVWVEVVPVDFVADFDLEVDLAAVVGVPVAVLPWPEEAIVVAVEAAEAPGDLLAEGRRRRVATTSTAAMATPLATALGSRRIGPSSPRGSDSASVEATLLIRASRRAKA